MNRKITLIIFLCVAICNAYGYKTNNSGTDSSAVKKNSSPVSIMASCSPATARADLDINNTKAMIQSGGDMWWDFTSAKYEIPKGSGRNSMFAGALWLGGRDVSGQLKVAAQMYRNNGNDFWTGPLSIIRAEITPETCTEYDKNFLTTRDEVAQFVAWYELGQTDPQQQQRDFPNYQIPKSILNWPAHGRNYDPYNEDFYLAPFYDRNNDGVYNPLDGDYPGYDLKNEHDCSQKIANIYGDQNIWWVFNDKGNVHTQTGSASIGMEIRAQAFAFATNDEVNNMTFYNYELVNRSTYTLTETYFGVFADADLGNPNDDYVGCDVKRGLGYCYNGDENDEDGQGAKGYGNQPPAIGIDFFQGPYQDADGFDNPLTMNYQQAVNEKGIPYKGIGIGYGDGIVDNERFGMRKFIYFNNGADPGNGSQYYLYLRSYWKNGSPMTYGGSGYLSPSGIRADYMFPDNTDPIGWGTGGVLQPVWSEPGINTPGDRRFVESAGPFTLAPGAVNNITTGVVWARAASGGAWASVLALRKADDKTQAMFDNCFRVLEGPHAPEVVIRELDRELIIYLNNKSVSNNYNEAFSSNDPFLVAPDSILSDDDSTYYHLTPEEKDEYAKYHFEGYQLYQVKDISVSPADLQNPEKAQLIAQCDVKNGIKKIVNFYYDSETNANIPVLEVNGDDKGIRHSFRVTDDAFATGDRRLVNHKKVYFMAIAYAYNHSPYNEYDPFNPAKLNGQTKPYLASRKAAIGGIQVFTAIPHKNNPENWGTIINSHYGDGVELTRVEGQGNGGNSIFLKKESLEEAVVDGKVLHPVYERGKGPVSIKVIDPLNIPASDFFIKLIDSVSHGNLSDGYHWFMWEKDKSSEGVYSEKSISVENEQLIMKWGLSVTAKQVPHPRTSNVSGDYGNDFLQATISFEDEKQHWLSGVPDAEGNTPQNWIRSGTLVNTGVDAIYDDRHYVITLPNQNSENIFLDEQQVYESLLGGTWAPYIFCAQEPQGPVPGNSVFSFPNPGAQNALLKLKYQQSVDIVFTPDKSKWTRCPVLEMQSDPTLSRGVIVDSVPTYYPDVPAPAPSKKIKGFIRSARSLDKNGKSSGDTLPNNNLESPNYISPYGMSWFPGYAVNVETGERLNIAFGEDSWLAAENGNDMLWNPTSKIFQGPFNDVRFGGKHYIFIFRNNIVEDNDGVPNPADRMPAYDSGKFIYEQLSKAKRDVDAGFKNVYRAAMWVGLPRLENGFSLLNVKDGLIPTETTVSIRVGKPYEAFGTQKYLSPADQLTTGKYYYVEKGPVVHSGTTYNHGQYFKAETNFFTSAGTDTTDNLISTENAGRPLYSFSTYDLATVKDSQPALEDALKLINVVPNPYYAYSEYETDKVDNRIKIINLPVKCSISIYTVSGTLVRKFTRDDSTITSIDWDLKNDARIPVASGVYIIHVDVPGVGERTLKWFGIMRPVDLDAF